MDAAIKVQPPEDLQQAITHTARQAIKQALIETKEKDDFPPYMTKTEAVKYLYTTPKTPIDWKKHCNDTPTIEIEGVTRY